MGRLLRFGKAGKTDKADTAAPMPLPSEEVRQILENICLFSFPKTPCRQQVSALKALLGAARLDAERPREAAGEAGAVVASLDALADQLPETLPALASYGAAVKQALNFAASKALTTGPGFTLSHDLHAALKRLSCSRFMHR